MSIQVPLKLVAPAAFSVLAAILLYFSPLPVMRVFMGMWSLSRLCSDQLQPDFAPDSRRRFGERVQRDVAVLGIKQTVELRA